MSFQSMERLEGLLSSCRRVSVDGLVPSAKPLFVSMLSHRSGKSVVYVAPDSFSAEGFADAASVFSDAPVVHVSLLGDDEEEGEARLASIPEGRVILATDVLSAMRRICDPESGRREFLVVKRGMSLSIESLASRLSSAGFSRVPLCERRRDFSVRGGIVDVFPVSGDPLRFEFFGDEVDSVRVFDAGTQRTTEAVDSASVFLGGREGGESGIIDYFPASSSIVVFDELSLLRMRELEGGDWVFNLASEDFSWDDLPEVSVPSSDGGETEAFIESVSDRPVVRFADWGEKGDVSFGSALAPSFGRDMGAFVSFVSGGPAERRILVLSPQAMRIADLMSEAGIAVRRILSPGGGFDADEIPAGASFARLNLTEGFVWGEDLYVITDSELFGARRRAASKSSRKPPVRLEDLSPGDFVVHSTYGIGVYRGLETKEIDRVSREFIKIEYSGGDMLAIPVEQIHLIDRYVRSDDAEPALSSLNGREWKRTKAKVKEEVEKTASRLLELYAKREAAEGFAFSPDSPWQAEMEGLFPYVETPDQLRAIEEAKRDMESPHPMERLVCGDAGYGKTEVALRCAFKAVMDGRQVAVLAPTTLLAEQHYSVFSERLASFPVRIELLSRFRKKSEQAAAVAGTALGDVDILIGTHRILSKDVSFKRLGLLVIDEEQYFGVIHKEKLREMKEGVDTLMLSATPIPRTLHLTMGGLKNLSVISTPPENRLPVRTVISPFRAELVKGAIMRERARGGKVFFLHNRIDGIETVARNLEELVPGIRTACAHAGMTELRLEKVVREFVDGEYDVLVCTTIIQSGIDMPDVNTIIINNAYDFGLAQLYQIRGRVGRGSHQAYAYLLYPVNRMLTSAARRRMEILRDFTSLGSGFHIAMKDLEMRGAGDMLGKAQHGFMQSVGFGLYCRMLSEAVERLKGGGEAELGDPVMDLPLSAFIPDSYISEQRQKLTVYRKIGSASSDEELRDLKEELRDVYGRPPEEVYNLFDAASLKLLLKRLRIPKLGYSRTDLYMLMPFVEFSKTFVSRLRGKGVPFSVSNNRLTLLGILEDEYWMEILVDFLGFFGKCMPKPAGDEKNPL